MDIQLKRGLLDVCVLAAIKDQESYGYQIIKDMKPFVELSESTLYPILRRLETAQLSRLLESRWPDTNCHSAQMEAHDLRGSRSPVRRDGGQREGEGLPPPWTPEALDASRGLCEAQAPLQSRSHHPVFPVKLEAYPTRQSKAPSG